MYKKKLALILSLYVSSITLSFAAIIPFTVEFKGSAPAPDGFGSFLYDNNPTNNGFVKFDLAFGSAYSFSLNEYTSNLLPAGTYSGFLEGVFRAFTDPISSNSSQFSLDRPFFDGSSIAGGLAIDGIGFPPTDVGLANGPGTYILFDYNIFGRCLGCLTSSYFKISSGTFDVKLSSVPLPATAILFLPGLIALGFVRRKTK